MRWWGICSANLPPFYPNDLPPQWFRHWHREIMRHMLHILTNFVKVYVDHLSFNCVQFHGTFNSMRRKRKIGGNKKLVDEPMLSSSSEEPTPAPPPSRHPPTPKSLASTLHPSIAHPTSWYSQPRIYSEANPVLSVPCSWGECTTAQLQPLCKAGCVKLICWI